MSLRYRKKPVVIEAMQWDATRESTAAIAGWAASHDFDLTGQLAGEGAHLTIHTLEGDMRATPGDWIIRGVQGEFYPCRSEIFEATYEEAL